MEVEQELTTPVQIAKQEDESKNSCKPPFRVVADGSKPVFRDSLITSDPLETEQILLRPPPLDRRN